MSKIADVGIPEIPTPLALANVGNGGHPSPPKTCRRLKWMVPYLPTPDGPMAAHGICFDFYYRPKLSQIGQNSLAAAPNARLAAV